MDTDHKPLSPLWLAGCIVSAAAASMRTRSTLDAAETQRFLRIIDNKGEHILDLIAELLDAARIDAGVLAVSPEPSDLSVLVGLDAQCEFAGTLEPVYIQIGRHVYSFGFAASTFESHSSVPFSSSLSFTLFSCSKVQSNPSS